ncbi:MAG: endonuclease MutS2 [candidate division WS1 bacterium]|nr:endonuclease MutS2 [candidate division WS1 bacterium]
MDARTLRVLEFDKVLALLAAQAQTHLGRERCLALRPRPDADWVFARLRETSEARALLTALGAPPFGGVADLHETLERAGVGAVLPETELLAVRDLAGACRRMRGYFERAEASPPVPLSPRESAIRWGEGEPSSHLPLVTLGLRLGSYPDLEEAIGQAITEEGEVRPDASPELSRLMRQRTVLRERLRQRMEALAQEFFRKGILQDPLVVERSGRLCLPVLTQFQSRFPGLVHDRSSSGLTLFMEPMAVVGQANELRGTELAIEEERQRILAELSRLVGAQAASLRSDLRRLTALDCIFAKARLALEEQAVEPRPGEILSLPEARHPLLGAKAVAIDFRLGGDFRTLVVTGPNTGGKTVALKTAGLLVLMAQSGLHVPAGIQAQMPVFAHVFADIGDEQSLEQSLSTFSSHLTQIVKVLNRVQAATRQGEGPILILLDEIGAGTDPTEGTALAQAILESLHAAGCLTAVSTHYNELKAFAYAQEGMENASVEFNAKTLEPTFRLLIGQPGSSNAFNIAQRLGLPKAIVARAKQRLGEVGRDFVRALAQVERTQQELSQRRREAAETSEELERLREQHAQELEEFHRQRREAMSRGFSEAQEIVRQARQQAGEIIAQLQSQPRHTAESERLRAELAEEQAALGKEEQALEEEMRQAEEAVAPPEAPRPLSKVEPGQRVRVADWNREGTVLELLGQDRALVAVGAFNVELPIEDLYEASEAPPPASGGELLTMRKQLTVPGEIHLRGRRVDEALAELDKYLDDAALAGREEVRIVHGKGTGALRQAIHDFLRTHPAVTVFTLAPEEEGGSGATVVKLLL